MLPVAILAGGLATRLRPVTDTIPKALIDVNGEPFVAHQLRLLSRNGVRRVVLCVGYLGEQIEEYVGNGSQFEIQVSYSRDGERLLGTAGAIRNAIPLLGDRFFVLYGDSYLPCDYNAIELSFLASGKLALMTVHGNDGKWDQSNVEFSAGRILRYDKTNRSPAMRHIDYGLAAVTRIVFEGVPPDRPSDLASLYRDLVDREQMAAYEVSERFYEVGSTEGIRELAAYLSR
jgi:N-acetyl-alpha-D-muramate 1-phosphate uridylyltransferase